MSQSKVTEAFEKLMLGRSPQCAYDDGLADSEDDNVHLQDQTHNKGCMLEECCVLRDNTVRPMSRVIVPSISGPIPLARLRVIVNHARRLPAAVVCDVDAIASAYCRRTRR